MGTDAVETTSALKTNDTNDAECCGTASKQRQEHFTLLQGKPCSSILEVAKDGTIHVQVQLLSPVNDSDSQLTVTSSAKECNLNVYASARCSKEDVFMNRAKPIALGSSGNAFRIGSRIFYTSGTSIVSPPEHFDVPELSFYIDHIEQHGKYLFVSSRQKLLETPGDDDTDSAKKDKKKDKSLQALLGKRKTQNDDSSESDSEATGSDSSVESEALSAYESWSEASTEHSETEILRDTRPQYAAVPGDNKEGGKNSTSENEDDSSSSASSESGEGSDNSDSDTESVEAPNTRYAHVMDDDEEYEMWDKIDGDPDEPFFDGDEFKGAWGDSGDESDGGGNAEADGDSDSSSDSDKDEAEKDDDKKKDDAVVNVNEQTKDVDDLNSKTTTSKQAEIEVKGSEESEKVAKDQTQDSEEKVKCEESEKKQDKEDPPSMLGNAVSQLQVFDLTASPTTRAFRFTRPTMQLVRDSPPVVHPTKSLVVWPLGDNNILFADYKHNTYFIRKFRASRFWSQHVKIECRFSEDGQYLHVASLEMRKNLPVKKKKSKSVENEKQDKSAEGNKDKEKENAKADEEKAKSKCDLLVLTYKLSQRKTTRAPPVLINRTQLSLGEIYLAKALPTFTWATREVFATHAVDCDLKVFRISLAKTSSLSGSNLPFGVQVPRVPIRIEATDQRAEVYFLPPEAMKHNGRLVIVKEQPAIKKFTLPANSNTEVVDEVLKADGDHSEALEVSSSKQGSESLNTEASQIGDDNQKTDELEKHHAANGCQTQILDIEIGSDADSWKDVDGSELDKMAEEGMGQMEAEMVKFDRTDDCDCCDD